MRDKDYYREGAANPQEDAKAYGTGMQEQCAPMPLSLRSKLIQRLNEIDAEERCIRRALDILDNQPQASILVDEILPGVPLHVWLGGRN